MPKKIEDYASCKARWHKLKEAFETSLRQAMANPDNPQIVKKEGATLEKILDTRVVFPHGDVWTIDAHQEDENKNKPIHRLAENGPIELIELFLKKGAHVNALNRYGDAPLHIAASGQADGLKIIEKLASWHADINARNMQGETPLHEAAKHNKPDNINALIKAGAYLEVATIWKNTPLHMASLCGSALAVDALLKAGADINARNDIGHTPFTLSKNIESAALFLKAGADVNTTNSRDETLLHWACHNDTTKSDLICFLLAQGANIHALKKDGDMPLHWTLKYRPDSAIIKILLEAGANPRKADGRGKTPYELALACGNKEIPEIVLSAINGEIAQHIENKKITALNARLEKIDALTGIKRRKITP